MKIPFYQKEWLGVDLVELAGSLNYDKDQVADWKIYRAVYERFFEGKENRLELGWITRKHRLSAWLDQYLKKYHLSDEEILSVGSGFGIIEQPLIKLGYKLDLQECQSLSLRYLKMKHPEEFDENRVYIRDLSELEFRKYGVVLAMTSTYCLSSEALRSFFSDISKLMNKAGLFIFYETTLRYIDFRNYLIHQAISPKGQGILWGWKRHTQDFIKLSKNFGLKLKEMFFFDNQNELLNRSIKLPYFLRNNIVWQLLVFQRD